MYMITANGVFSSPSINGQIAMLYISINDADSSYLGMSISSMWAGYTMLPATVVRKMKKGDVIKLRGTADRACNFTIYHATSLTVTRVG